MTTRVTWALPADLAAADAELVAGFDATLRRGEARAAHHLACRPGCTECCRGTFDITALDAARLVRGLAELAGSAPAATRAVRERASAQWLAMAPAFPGDATSGVLASHDGARTRFVARFSELACPALDPGSGACALYRWRPLSCRTFGLPVRFGTHALAPCTRNFTRAGDAEVAAATVEPDPGDREGALLAEAERRGTAGDTTVCAAIAASGQPGEAR